MSVPRPILPGTTYMVTRRCFGRQFLLRPSPRVNQIFKFCLAVAATKSGILLHGFCMLSNHYHLVLTDSEGTLPVFMHWLNEYVAKCMNAEVGRWESFWAPGSYSAVALVDREDILNKLVYVHTNAVAARLVRRHEDWPGANSSLGDLGGEPEVIDRPDVFFRKNGPVPDRARLALVLPPAFQMNAAEMLGSLQARIRQREAEIQRRCLKRGARFLGSDRVLAQSPFSRPSSFEPRRGLNPRLACLDRWRRVEALRRLKGFVAAYREALRRFCAVERLAVFPYGTYGMRARFDVVCAGP